MKPLPVSKTAAGADPSLVRNTFVKVCCWGGKDYSPPQRIGNVASIDDGEVHQGGPHPFFENQGLACARETLLALGFDGAIDDLRINPRVLSASEIHAWPRPLRGPGRRRPTSGSASP